MHCELYRVTVETEQQQNSETDDGPDDIGYRIWSRRSEVQILPHRTEYGGSSVWIERRYISRVNNMTVTVFFSALAEAGPESKGYLLIHGNPFDTDMTSFNLIHTWV